MLQESDDLEDMMQGLEGMCFPPGPRTPAPD